MLESIASLLQDFLQTLLYQFYFMTLQEKDSRYVSQTYLTTESFSPEVSL